MNAIPKSKEQTKEEKSRFSKRPSLKNRDISTFGATGETRTPDLTITNRMLYQLSHSSILFSFLAFKPSFTSVLRMHCSTVEPG